MDRKSAPSKRLDIEQVYEILSICTIDGMTRTEIKSRAGLSDARVSRYLERLSVNQMIRREANGYYHLTTPGHDLYKRLTRRPMDTIKRVEQMLESEVATGEAVASVKPRKSCSRCSGDFSVHNGELGCIQCGLYYYPKADLPLVYPGLTAAVSGGGISNWCERNWTIGLAGRIINAVVRRVNWPATFGCWSGISRL